MKEYAGINVRLSREEFDRLCETAQRDMRLPRDQARYLLRLALGLGTNELFRDLPVSGQHNAEEVPNAG